MLKLKRNSLSVALASAILMTAQAAHAQDNRSDQATELDAITVTGIRRGIENAIETKRDATSIVEAISAEDIGKLPDTSIAESIARLPGLAAQRVAGRASTITIRGLADDFTTTLLNGREQVSSGQNRGVEFDQYPSELINQVLIYKTPDASLVAQGISGTVDLQTVRPLSFPGRVVSVNVRGEKHSMGEVNPGYDDTGYRVSGSYIDQFLDGRLGVAIGYARLDSPVQAERWSSWGYPTGTIGNVNDVVIPGGVQPRATSNETVRDGLMAVVEFRPNDFYSGLLDIYYSKFDRDETSRWMEFGLGWSGATLSNPVVQDGVLVSGTFTGVKPVVRNDLNTREDDIFAIGFKNEFQFNDDWKGVADFSMSRATRDEMILETYAGTVGVTDTAQYRLDPRTGRGLVQLGLNYADPAIIKLTDSGGWNQDGYVKFPKYEDELRSARFALQRGFESGMISGLEFGANFSNREKSRNVAEAFLDLKSGNAATVPADLLNRPASLGWASNAAVIAYNVPAVFSQFYDTRTHVHPDILNKDWTVEEDVLTSFVKLDIDTELGSVPVRGNIGLQNVRADQESEGFALPGGSASAAVPFAAGTDYDDWLPSLNLAFTLPADQMLRFGAAKQVARPRMDQMRASSSFGVDRTRNIWSGDGGNPQLEPWRAKSYDLSYEKYFGGRGYLSVAAFHKDLTTYIYNETVEFDFSVYDLTTIPLPHPPTTIGRFTKPINGEGGSLNGFEYALSVPLDMAWSALDGFGLIASYSDTRSSIRPLGPGTTQPLPGLSRYVSNVTFYYEKHGFSARVSQRKRSDFIGEVQGFGADRETRFIKGEEIVDFQTSYDFTRGALKGLSLLLQINNLTNEPYVELLKDAGLPDRVKTYDEYGRTVLVGATYKF